MAPTRTLHAARLGYRPRTMATHQTHASLVGRRQLIGAVDCKQPAVSEQRIQHTSTSIRELGS
jgi:hypothetical protein